MIQLYAIRQCPFCEKVRRAFAELGVEYQEVSAEYGTPGSAELVKLGGKTQTPFLVDSERGVSMYESDDIIAYAQEYLRKN